MFLDKGAVPDATTSTTPPPTTTSGQGLFRIDSFLSLQRTNKLLQQLLDKGCSGCNNFSNSSPLDADPRRRSDLIRKKTTTF
jgi:hypothetical protein